MEKLKAQDVFVYTKRTELMRVSRLGLGFRV